MAGPTMLEEFLRPLTPSRRIRIDALRKKLLAQMKAFEVRPWRHGMKSSFSLIVIAFLIFPAPLVACTCVFVENCGVGFGPHGDAVFLGTVISKQLGDGRNPNGTLSLVVPSVVRFAVAEAYYGVDSKEVTVETTEGCCACGYPFEVGQAYLVHAHGRQGKLTTSTCTRTQPALTAAAVIQQFQAMQRGISPASLFGMVSRVPPDARVEGRLKHSPMTGVTVRLRSDDGAEFEAVTDTEGAYQFWSLPPGKYEIQPLLPPGLTTRARFNKQQVMASIGAGKICEQDIGVYSDGRIAGRIVTPDGSPVPGFVTVEPAHPAERAAARRRGGYPGFITGPDGRFELNLLWPGRYRLILRVQAAQGVRLHMAYYYPEVIELAEGEHVDDLVFLVRSPP